jgi:Domain of unknown function (DUF5069)
MTDYSRPDLTQHPPRSRRCRLGGYAHLPRLLDKARALAAGKIGEYHYNCPADREFFDFTGIGHEELLAEAKAGRTDSELLAWVQRRAPKLAAEIFAWSAWMDQHGPGGAPGLSWASGEIKRLAESRTDICTFNDLLDLDDYATFGGKA